MKNKIMALQTFVGKASTPKAAVPFEFSKLLFEFCEVPSFELPNGKPLVHNSKKTNEHLLECQLPRPPATSVNPSEDSDLQQTFRHCTRCTRRRCSSACMMVGGTQKLENVVVKGNIEEAVVDAKKMKMLHGTVEPIHGVYMLPKTKKHKLC